jgi:uncharacterized membrane protein YfhO
MEIESESDSPSLVVIAQGGYPSWSARIDGRPAVIERANVAFQAIALPSGKHTVVLQYSDRPFRFGLACSFVIGAVMWRIQRRSNRRG